MNREFLSGISPRSDKLNEKALKVKKHEYYLRIKCFFDIVGLHTFSKDSIRVRIKNNVKRRGNKKVSSSKSVEESFYEHIDLNSNI